MRRAVVTGGAGFIGSHIVDAITDAGFGVSVIDDLSTGFEHNVRAGTELKKLDIRSAEAREYLAANPPEVLIHCAAQASVRVSMDDPVLDVGVNVLGLVNLLQAFPREKLPYVVFLSTGGAIYGEQEEFPAPEDHPIAPTSVYGLSKYAGEQYLEFWVRNFGLQRAVLRLANVYGPRQNPHGEAGVVAIFAERLIEKKTCTIYGSGDQTRDFVSVFDVVAAVRAVVEKRVSGTFNIGTGVETSVNALYGVLCRAAGVELPAQYGPRRAGEQLRSVVDPARAKQTFGWHARADLEHGIRETVDWFRENSPAASGAR